MEINILWDKDDNLALALSGGVDSIALFHLLVTKYRDSYMELVVFHINHGLRHESYEEAEFVEQFVKKYNVKFFKRELEMKKISRSSHISEEMHARDLRYKAFGELAKEANISKILTAHHKNDQVENILMRLLSGRSVDYNLMIDNVVDRGEIRLYRPLLNILKEELERYAKENDLKYYVDATNFDTDYTRNNIRHNIVPLLNDVNAASFDNLINFASYYRNINEQLKEDVLARKGNCIKEKTENKIVFSREKLLSLSDEEINFLFKHVLTEEFGIFDIRQRALLKIIEQLKQNSNNKSYDLKNNLKIVSEYDAIYIHKIEKKCYNDRIELIIDEVCTESSYKFYHSEFQLTTSNTDAEVGFNEEDLPLRITTRMPGDSVRRGNITKKISRLLIDEKVPKELRDRLPVVRSKDSILGVLGIGARVNKNKKFDYYIKMKGQ